MINYIERGDLSGDVFLVVHGLGEHIGRYERFIEFLNDNGFGVVGFDLPGHGKSSGIRGHASFKKIMKIVDRISKSLEKPPIIFGHSLGGLIAIRYAQSGGRLKALIASSPGLHYDREKVPDGLVLLAKILSIFVPFLTMNNRLDVEYLSRNEEAVRRYLEDPLVHDRISVKLASDFFSQSKKAIEEAGRINVPTLVLVGSEDRITPPEGARRFFENLKVEKRKLVEYEGGYHELFEDQEYSEKFFEDVVSFAMEVLRWEGTGRL